MIPKTPVVSLYENIMNSFGDICIKPSPQSFLYYCNLIVSYTYKYICHILLTCIERNTHSGYYPNKKRTFRKFTFNIWKVLSLYKLARGPQGHRLRYLIKNERICSSFCPWQNQMRLGIKLKVTPRDTPGCIRYVNCVQQSSIIRSFTDALLV